MGRSIQTARTTTTYNYRFRKLRAVRRLRDTSISLIRAQNLDLRLSAVVPPLWTLARLFVSSSTDLREVQINNIQTRAGAAAGGEEGDRSISDRRRGGGDRRRRVERHGREAAVVATCFAGLRRDECEQEFHGINAHCANGQTTNTRTNTPKNKPGTSAE